MDPAESLQELPARRGFSIFYRGKTLLSRIDPVAQGDRLADGIVIRERTLYFCPSPLYGYGLSLFLEKLRGKPGSINSAILCVEADDKLFEISKRTLEGLGDTVSSCSNSTKAGSLLPIALAKAADPESICAFVKDTWGERVFRRVEEIHLTGGWQLFPQLYEDLGMALRREMALEWGNAMTLIRLGRLYARNLIQNLASLPESEDMDALDYGSSPVLVLGAGPSLDPLLDELSILSGGTIPGPEKRRYKIICVDTCIPALIDRSIVPDLVVVLESQHWNLRDFTGLRGRNMDIALDLSALPASARVFAGKRFFFSTRWTQLKLLERLEEACILPETFAPMGSVGLSAVALALDIGCGPVITGGIDFSYTLDAYHARSTPGAAILLRKQNRMRSIINIAAFAEGTFSALSKAGTAVRSDPVMRSYRNLFKQEFSGNPRLVDTRGTGLPLGTGIISASDAYAMLNGETQTGASISNDMSGFGEKSAHPENISRNNRKAKFPARKISGFIRSEADALKTLRGMLTGESPVEPAILEELLDDSDYLWAHFPECAGAGGRRPPCTDLGFLKRVRTEIEPFLKLWEMTLCELGKNEEPRGKPRGMDTPQ